MRRADENGADDVIVRTSPFADTDRIDERRPITLPRRRRFGSAVGRNQILERSVVTDARARVDARLPVFARSGRFRRTFVGVPLLMVVTDLLVLGVETLAVHDWTADAGFFALLVVLSRFVSRYYRPRLQLAMLDDIPRAIGTVLSAFALTLAAVYFLTSEPVSEKLLVQRALVFLALGLLAQGLAFGFARRRRSRNPGRRTLVIGNGRLADAVADAIADQRDLGLTTVGLAGPGLPFPAVPVTAADMKQLPRLIVEREIDTAILALDQAADEVDTIIAVHQTGCDLFLVPPVFELHHDGPDVERIRGIPLLRLRPDPTLRWTWWIKRSLDMLVGGLGLLILSVPLGVIALAVLISSGRPVLFWQERVGLDGHTFRLCKFRSMRPVDEAESQSTWNIGGDPRVNAVGRVLRRTSLDEVPQLWNILRGQMSLVGPRPERPSFVQKFSNEHDRYWARHRVPVGLTGLAQVSGLRGDTSINERARFDNYYIANWSLWLDVKIMLLTVREVLSGGGR